MSYKGKFKPKNKTKYKGDPTNIVYRSLLELNFMNHLDSWNAVLEWSSEEIAIPYVSPVDNKLHRYFPDFWIKVKTKDNKIEENIIEVKPLKECHPPKRPEKINTAYRKQFITFAINTAKWKAAEIYCAVNNMKFIKVTDKEIKQYGK